MMLTSHCAMTLKKKKRERKRQNQTLFTFSAQLRLYFNTQPLQNHCVAYHPSACVGLEVRSGLQRADTMGKVTSAGMMTEFLSENMTVLDLTVKAD